MSNQEDGTKKINVQNWITLSTVMIGAVLTILALIWQNPPPNGIVAVFNNGSIRYDPLPDYFGADSLRYTVEDNSGGVSNSALVTITINDINDKEVL